MLNPLVLKLAIEQALDGVSNDENIDPTTAREQLATNLADAIDAYIKSGQVNVTVTTTGSATNQAGVGIGTIN